MDSPLYLIVCLGPEGAAAIERTAHLVHDYHAAYWKALVLGHDDVPDEPRLPSCVTNATAYWVRKNFLRNQESPAPNVPAGVVLYRVPAKGWTLYLNGVSFVVNTDQGTQRALATFRDGLPAGVRVNETKDLMLQRETPESEWILRLYVERGK